MGWVENLSQAYVIFHCSLANKIEVLTSDPKVSYPVGSGNFL